VHVSAKDLGTGNEQKVTITASTNLSDDDINTAVKEAERYAAEDKKKKEEVETRNNADSLVYQTEKNLKDLEDKLGSEDKAKIEAELNSVKEALKGTDTQAIKAATEELNKVFYDISSKIYQSTAGGPRPGGPEGAEPQDDNTINADYKVEDDK
jgi:molecular chaperone DnaK